jgi:large subunit ribosomal protein L25
VADTATLQAQRRTVMGKAVKQLRKQGLVPANISGHTMESIPIQIERVEWDRMLKANPHSKIIKLAIPGAPAHNAMIGHVERDPVSGAIKHIDFLHIELNQPIHARVPIRVMGESEAVKNGDGMVLQLIDHLEVQALPGDLPEAIPVDVTGLANVGDTMYMHDLTLPAKVTALHLNADEAVVKIVHVRAAEAEAAAEVPGPEAAAAAAEEGKHQPETAAQ